MPFRLRACPNADCTVWLFKADDGCCPGCGTPGDEVPITLVR